MLLFIFINFGKFSGIISSNINLAPISPFSPFLDYNYKDRYFHCVLDVSNTISELFILVIICVYYVGPSSYFLFNHLSYYTIYGVLNFNYCIFYFLILFEYFMYSLPLKTHIFISYQIHHIFISRKLELKISTCHILQQL